MKTLFKRLWIEENGNDVLEYGLLLGMLSLGTIVSAGDIGTALIRLFADGSPSTVAISVS